MQFALPPRQLSTSHPPYIPSTRLSLLRRRQLKAIAVFGLALLTIFYLLSYFSFSRDSPADVTPAGTPNVVIVTLFDREGLSDSHIQMITKNREYYAMKHGYTNFFANTSDYLYAFGSGIPCSWALIPAVRHAMATHPYSTYFFHLNPHALIMNPDISVTSHVLDRKRIESLMLKDIPVVPPDSVIKTFSHVKGNNVEFILSQDKEDLTSDNFFIKQGDWAHFLLDTWFDPLYRSYGFAKAEKHALDHIVQWHPTILTKMALLPQRVFNAYSKDSPGAVVNGTYQDGDFIIRFSRCQTYDNRDCEQEMQPFYKSWQKSHRQN